MVIGTLLHVPRCDARKNDMIWQREEFFYVLNSEQSTKPTRILDRENVVPHSPAGPSDHQNKISPTDQASVPILFRYTSDERYIGYQLEVA